MSISSELNFRPAWWVPGPHAQTLWGKFARRLAPVAARSELWKTPDDDELELLRLPATAAGAPRMLLLHGLEGTINSHYLRGALHYAARRGWAADVLIFRGCNGRLNNRPRLYHSGETTDLDFVVQRLVRESPNQPLFLAGYSLGGNVLLKWLGERGSNVPGAVLSAVTVSVPYDLERGSRHIERGFSRIYTRHFLRTLKRKASAKLAQFPGLFHAVALQRARTLFEFDDAVTAPLHGFAGAHDYYSKSSSIRFLSRIRIPTLLLSAADDPFLPADVLDDVSILSLQNPYLHMVTTKKGGHVGFVGGRTPWSPNYFSEELMFEHFDHAISRRPVAAAS